MQFGLSQLRVQPFWSLWPCKTDVRCVAKVIKAGRNLSLAEAEIYDMDDKLVAVSQVNYISLDS